MNARAWFRTLRRGIRSRTIVRFCTTVLAVVALAVAACSSGPEFGRPASAVASTSRSSVSPSASSSAAGSAAAGGGVWAASVARTLAAHPPTWTGWKDGQLLSDVAAGEVDAPGPNSPPRTQVLAQGTTRRGKGWIDDAATYYVAPSGAGVVDAGSMDLGCASRSGC